MDEHLRKRLIEGATVKVTQQIPARHYALTSEIEGIIVKFQQKQTGSWYAHSRGDKLWLDRLCIRKPDGELTTLNLDDYSRVEVLSDSAPPAAADEPAPAADVPA